MSDLFALLDANRDKQTAPTEGWTPTDPAILAAAGNASVGFAGRLKGAMVTSLEGLAERLEQPGAAFLDIGVGVAALSVEMARLWPELTILGIDPWPPALALARQRVGESGFADRITLRQQAGQALTETSCFDLAWLPSAFIAEASIPAILERAHAALRPGGWLLFAMLRLGNDLVSAAIAEHRRAMLGGFLGTQEAVESHLRAQGFVGIRALPGATTSLTCIVVGRRPFVSFTQGTSMPDVTQTPNANPPDEALAVIAFWRDAGPALWFAKDPDFDQRFRTRFLLTHEAAASGSLSHWGDTAQGALALVILLDQFPRNAFRGTPRMYATDEQARKIADQAIRAGHDRQVDDLLGLFFRMPFAHSEIIADQERSVALAERFGEPNLSRAKGHRDIVVRFGRFPHRNPILGRVMRPEEQRFLDEGGYGG
ncbi:DUF924 family protein [Roseomonas sp. CCTCC AB2023176]|uniref:DUF924 family protein n=1 Tax=Roseomonas sp. CCTCC AB2023176 TaxID=3342640 RepID=UPI0035DA56DE